MKMLRPILLLSIFFALSLSGPITLDREVNHTHSPTYIQDQSNKYQSEHIYVHLISHTHDDIGWLKTVD